MIRKALWLASKGRHPQSRAATKQTRLVLPAGNDALLEGVVMQTPVKAASSRPAGRRMVHDLTMSGTRNTRMFLVRALVFARPGRGDPCGSGAGSHLAFTCVPIPSAIRRCRSVDPRGAPSTTQRPIAR